ncbi:MAG: aminodeoxychorismate synthase component I [Porticoccaceae bacterium]|jgi:para-aminobenzoate synthetase component I|nr:aminodeoxychorismate synthase component I [Porticoccaceae bacterium]
MQTIRTMDIPYQQDSAVLFAALRDLPDSIWLDSGKPRSLQGCFDIISASPDSLVETRGGQSKIIDGNGSRTTSEDPFLLAKQLLEPMLGIEQPADIPFVGGLLGYFGYDLGRYLIDIPDTAATVADLPDMRVGRYLWSLVINHQARRSQLFFHPLCPESLETDISLRLSNLEDSAKQKSEPFKLTTPFRPTLSKGRYRESLTQIKDYIASGDCYQTNFTQHLSAKYHGDVWQAYLALREATPAPYGAFWQWPDQAILSISPERFIKTDIENEQISVESKPIKGTILRGTSLEEDQENAIQLVNSTKDRAENLMIVDLLRNDLSKNCEPGSIRVPKLFNLETFPNVHHLVSTVTGILRSDRSVIDLLRDSFPGGSITGAPKKRAMEIIEQLEPVRRSVYCGSIGYISASNRMDTNIAIRTMVADGSTIHCWGGGGIVADSEADAEFEESMNKIRVLLTCLEEL